MISILVSYELRRAIARKRIILLIALIFLVEAAIYLILTLLPSTFIQVFGGYAWIIGLAIPSTILLHVLALTIGSATFSEEYEQGTADFWLTRPITRIEYFAGKFLGSLAFTSLIVASYSILGLVFSWWVFGPQLRLDLLVAGALASIFASLTFLTMGLAVGEVLRRTMLATILAATGFFSSLIIETYLGIVGAITNDQSITSAARYLPSWAAGRLVITVISSGLGFEAGPIGLLAGGTQTADILPAVLNIMLYSAVFLAVALIRLVSTDVTRKAT